MLLAGMKVVFHTCKIVINASKYKIRVPGVANIVYETLYPDIRLCDTNILLLYGRV